MPLRSDQQQYMLHSKTQKQLEEIVHERTREKQGEWFFMTFALLIAGALFTCLYLAITKTDRGVEYSYGLGITTGAAFMDAAGIFFISGQKLIRIQHQIRYIRKHPSKYAIRRHLAGVFLVAKITPEQATRDTSHGCRDCSAVKNCQLALEQLYSLQRSYVKTDQQPPAEVTDAYLAAFNQARGLNKALATAGQQQQRKIDEFHLGLTELTTQIEQACSTFMAANDTEALGRSRSEAA